MNQNKFIWIGLAIAIILSFVGLVGGNNQSASNTLGDAGSRFPHGISIGSSAAPVNNGVLVGTNGTNMSNVKTGICYLAPLATTIAGSTYQKVPCQATAAPGATTIDGSVSALSGVTANDTVLGSLSTTTAFGLATTSAAIVNNTPLTLVNFIASSTAGYIDAVVFNASTSPYLWATGANASGTIEFLDIKFP